MPTICLKAGQNLPSRLNWDETGRTVKDKIRIVEGERSISGFIRAILTSNGFDVIVARSGSEALSMISSHCPDLVVLDLGLPDVDGMEKIGRAHV